MVLKCPVFLRTMPDQNEKPTGSGAPRSQDHCAESNAWTAPNSMIFQQKIPLNLRDCCNICEYDFFDLLFASQERRRQARLPVTKR